MKPKIFIIFDQNHDKDWLIDELISRYDGSIVVVRIGVNSSQMEIKSGAWGKFINIFYTIKPCIKTLLKSQRGEIIICWGSYAGAIVNLLSLLLGNKRYLIYPGWLTPVKHQKTYLLSKLAAINPKCQITITSPDLEEQWLKHLRIKTHHNFHYVPDMFESKDGYKPITIKNPRYFFTGGMANRDWKLLMQVASQLPEEKFKCVALKSDFENKVTSIPNNVEVFYNLESEKYYQLMQNAKAVLLPLVDRRKISGLINIIRAAQYGTLCCVTKTIATAQYYNNSQFLIENDVKEWVSIVKKISATSDENYIQITEYFQSYIKNNFSRQRVSDLFFNIINDLQK